VEFVANYNPAKGDRAIVTPEQWKVLADFVRGAVAPLTWMTANSLRPFLSATTRLALWADEQGLPLEAAYLFSPDLLSAYLATREDTVAHSHQYLTRLGLENGVTTSGGTFAGIARPDYQAPYAKGDITALTSFARAMTNLERRATLGAVIALGAGAGVVRARLRYVDATCVHDHDDGHTYVATATGCARVSADYVDLLTEVCELRPEGQLIGAVFGETLTAHIAKWVSGRKGVPELNVDRLRATYVVSLLDANTPLREVLAWTGLKSAEALDGYLAYASLLDTQCAHPGPQAR